VGAEKENKIGKKTESFSEGFVERGGGGSGAKPRSRHNDDSQFDERRQWKSPLSKSIMGGGAEKRGLPLGSVKSFGRGSDRWCVIFQKGSQPRGVTH